MTTPVDPVESLQAAVGRYVAMQDAARNATANLPPEQMPPGGQSATAPPPEESHGVSAQL